MLIERDLHCRQEFAAAERLDEVAVGSRRLGPRNCRRIAVCREIHDRHVEDFAQPGCRLDPIHGALEHHVHQYRVRTCFLRHRDRLCSGERWARDGVAGELELMLDLHGDNAFVFDNEDLGRHRIHACPTRAAAAGNVIQTVVPALRSSESIPPSWRLSMSTSFSPSVDGFSVSMPAGSPIPSSLTTSLICPASSWEIRTRTSPLRPSGKACFSAFDTSSFKTRPQGMSVSRSMDISHTSTARATLRRPSVAT